MFFKGLEGFLRAQTAELSQKLTELIGDIVPVYNTEVDENMDASLKDAYSHISSIIDSWIKLVLQMQALENNSDTASASLTMPDGTHEYKLIATVWGVPSHEQKQNIIPTHIGIMDYFMYRCICDIPNNPVQIFYSWIKKECDLAHALVTLSPDGYVPEDVKNRLDAGEQFINWDSSEAEGFDDDVLNPLLLSLAGINDPLNLCSLDACVSHIEEFFDSFGFHEGRVSL